MVAQSHSHSESASNAWSLRRGPARVATAAFFLALAHCSSTLNSTATGDGGSAKDAGGIAIEDASTKDAESHNDAGEPADAAIPVGIVATLSGGQVVAYDLDDPEARKFTLGGDVQTQIVGSDTEKNRIHVIFPGAATGTFSCADGAALLRTNLDTNQGYRADNTVEGTDCSVTALEVGPVGGRVRGRFSGMVKVIGSSPPVTTLQPVVGSFDVIRAADVP